MRTHAPGETPFHPQPSRYPGHLFRPGPSAPQRFACHAIRQFARRGLAKASVHTSLSEYTGRSPRKRPSRSARSSSSALLVLNPRKRGVPSPRVQREAVQNHRPVPRQSPRHHGDTARSDRRPAPGRRARPVRGPRSTIHGRPQAALRAAIRLQRSWSGNRVDWPRPSGIWNSTGLPTQYRPPGSHAACPGQRIVSPGKFRELQPHHCCVNDLVEANPGAVDDPSQVCPLAGGNLLPDLPVSGACSSQPNPQSGNGRRKTFLRDPPDKTLRSAPPGASFTGDVVRPRQFRRGT